jgi:GH15 family glucan-1,4-alpha-glucosidase
MCCVALDRACRLAERGFIPDRSERWRAEANAIRRFLDEHAWDGDRNTYRRANDLPDADGSLLLLAIYGYDDPAGDRANGVIAAVRAQLQDGPLVDRYRGDDGVPGQQGIFWTCSFWLAAALAKAGRLSEASALMDELVPLANDVGLYAEETDRDGTFLGNFPQALVHLALIDAATTIAEVDR